MISLTQRSIVYHTKEVSIVKWEVWFQTPVGLFQNLDEAIKRTKELDLDPDLIVRPVAVAVGTDNLYEILER